MIKKYIGYILLKKYVIICTSILKLNRMLGYIMGFSMITALFLYDLGYSTFLNLKLLVFFL